MIEITDKEYRYFAEYIQKNYGISLGTRKQALVAGRLQNVLLQLNMTSFSQYFEHVVSDLSGEAALVLLNRITTNHTFFMREADHFAFFRDTVLPYLNGSLSRKDLRIWSAGCSTGEEPYTLAILIDEFFGGMKAEWDRQILATDISGRVLEAAGRGEYEEADMQLVPPVWKRSYFKRNEAGKYCIFDRIKEEVIFRKLNLVDEVFPFRNKFHVIFCRNVMIYFDNRTKNELVRKFSDLLEPGGYLFIGHSESLSREMNGFRLVRSSVYIKT